ncbi:MAG TPA: ABC transporter ATP-binding protein [Acidimicrobiales bacterium]|nr:ABC transporter ATP-binding protein [Acidimicrobiales bacterium]
MSVWAPEAGARATTLGGISVGGLTKRFGPNLALDSVDLEVLPGRITALLGRNGAGKSTLIRILATSVLPDEGQATVDGHDVVAEPRAARSCIGLVLGEERSYFWRLSGQKNLEFFAALQGLDRASAREASSRALEVVGLGEVAARRADRYSTGMRSRLGIARALLGEPSVLLLDEPTRSLDPAAAAEVRALVRTLAVERAVAVLLATHDLHEAADLASEVLVLERGRVVTRRHGGESAADLETAVVGAFR